MRRAVALLILGGLALGVVYYWKRHPGQLPQVRGDGLGSVGAKLGEVGRTVSEKFRATKTKGAVKAALELNRNLNAYPIDVDAEDDGTVVLRGAVPTEDLRGTAERVAAGVPDVARVHNQIRVDATLPAPPSEGRTLGENFDDRALEAKVKLAYSLNKDMKGADVKVSAYRREVTLGGTVTSDAQRQLAIQIAQQTPQVSAVKDGLQVAGAVAAPAAGKGSSGGRGAGRRESSIEGQPDRAALALLHFRV